MNRRLLAAALLFGVPALGQAPTGVNMAPVDTAKEPHHHLMVDNTYVRAFRFSLPAGESTLLHAHDEPYLAVSLGAAEFANDVAGKPEARGKTADGQVNYSRGGFAHLVKADAGVPFNNVTIELLHPQGEPRNLCDKIVPGDLGACNLSSDEPNAPIGTRPVLETDELRVDSLVVRRAGDVVDKPHTLPGLLIAVSGAPVKVARVPGMMTQILHPGEMMWLQPQAEPKFTVEDGPEARLVLISFKDGAGNPSQ
ncbi:MAG TPA: hypothetical protein VKF79_02205 [Candidatus Acidoferrum sp.]|nr:hypothetical protein [Candidatus Acidoferrum sp.]